MQQQFGAGSTLVTEGGQPAVGLLGDYDGQMIFLTHRSHNNLTMLVFYHTLCNRWPLSLIKQGQSKGCNNMLNVQTIWLINA